MSTPVTFSTARPPSPVETSCRVTTPSINTSGMPLMVTMMTTRSSGIGTAPDSRNSVWSGERWLNEKLRSNPLWRPGSAVTLTLTLVRASRTGRGTGTGTTGPIMSVR